MNDNTQLQLSANSILSLFETNKEQRKSFVDNVMDALRNEQVDPLKIHLQIKAMEEIINSFTVTDEKKNKLFTQAIDYRKMLLDAAELHGKKFQLHNAEFSIKEVGTKYDFSQCGHTELVELFAQQSALDKKIKDIQDMLKTLPSAGIEMIMESTGEALRVYPPSKISTTAVAVSLK